MKRFAVWGKATIAAVTIAVGVTATAVAADTVGGTAPPTRASRCRRACDADFVSQSRYCDGLKDAESRRVCADDISAVRTECIARCGRR